MSFMARNTRERTSIDNSGKVNPETCIRFDRVKVSAYRMERHRLLLLATDRKITRRDESDSNPCFHSLSVLLNKNNRKPGVLTKALIVSSKVTKEV